MTSGSFRGTRGLPAMRLRLPWLPRLLRRAPALAPRLTRVIDRLQSLPGATEHEFLHLGNRLQEIVARAGEERAKLAGLLDSVSCAGGESLSGMLDEVSRWAAQTGSAVETGDRFRHLLLVIRSVGGQIEELRNRVRTLRVMGVVTRIESARLGSAAASFETLAGDVSSLAVSIEEKAGAVEEAVAGACELATSAARTVTDMERRQQSQVGAMTAACAQCLQKAEEEQRRIDDVSRRAQERYQAFSREVGKVVAALQIHDSTRQRIEHIVHALRDAQGSEPLVRSAGPMIELQAAQLSEARAAFLETLAGIRADLERLSGNVADCARMAQDLMGPRDSQRNVLDDLEQRFDEIAAAVSELAESRHQAASGARQVRQSGSRMSGFVADIEAIGERMLRLALNAEIQAVHLAETGVVMEAVAGGIRQAAEGASASAREAGNTLQQVSIAAENALAGRRETDPEGAGAGGELVERLRRLAARLKTTGQTSMQMLASIASGSSALASEVDSLRRSMHAEEIFEEAASSCASVLREIAAAAATTGRPADSAGAIARSGANYTMHAERDVHRAFTGVSGSPQTAGAAAEFGENVELF